MKYPVLLADPPWRYSDRGSRAAPEFCGHYRTQTTAEICETFADERAQVADTAILFLWSTWSHLIDGDAARVANAWGFTPKAGIPWVKVSANGKPRIGMGHYTRACSEPLLLCTRGKATRLIRSHSVPGVIIAPRGEHSTKPDESYRLIERLCDGPYLELYARTHRGPQWHCHGNQLEAA